MVQRQVGNGASVGGTKLIILIIIALAGGIFLAAKLGPVYQTKWEMEDFMEDLMRRYHVLGQEGMFINLQSYVDNNKLGFNVDDNCTFEGEDEAPGKFDCNYEVNLGIPNLEKFQVHAHADVPKIPSIAN